MWHAEATLDRLAFVGKRDRKAWVGRFMGRFDYMENCLLLPSWLFVFGRIAVVPFLCASAYPFSEVCIPFAKSLSLHSALIAMHTGSVKNSKTYYRSYLNCLLSCFRRSCLAAKEAILIKHHQIFEALFWLCWHSRIAFGKFGIGLTIIWANKQANSPAITMHCQ